MFKFVNQIFLIASVALLKFFILYFFKETRSFV